MPFSKTFSTGIVFFTAFTLLFCHMANAEPIYNALNTITIDDDDFIRNRDPALWQGLKVRRETFKDGGASWALWRVQNVKKPSGPLWLQLHDNENGAFAAALYGLRIYGGAAVFVDTGPRDKDYSARLNANIKNHRPIDPNRNFIPKSIYTEAILKDLGTPPRLMISIHTNSPGFDGEDSDCNSQSDQAYGRGKISIFYCDDIMKPRKSVTGRYPFEDTDSLAIIPYPANGHLENAYCAQKLIQADFNILFERIKGKGDKSLSNYAMFAGYKYVNIETQDRGTNPQGLNDASARASIMIDDIMKHCPQ